MEGKQHAAEGLFKQIWPHDSDLPARYLGLFLATLGRVEEAFGIYYPIAKAAIASDAPRKPYYDYDQVLSSSSVEIQSQRFNMTPELKARMIESIKGHLAIGPEDNLLDIGGAGGLFAIELAPLVNTVMLTDINKDLVERARLNTRHLGNVDACVDDAVVMSSVHDIFNKVLMYGVS
jgi:protein-L-isoaspartate O-methyltransferase